MKRRGLGDYYVQGDCPDGSRPVLRSHRFPVVRREARRLKRRRCLIEIGWRDR